MAGIEANEARRNALTFGDPTLLIGQDIIRYAEYLMREEHRVLEDGFQFWGGVADWLNYIACTPDKSGQTTSDWSRFNGAISTAVGYIEMSRSSHVLKIDLLNRFFQPKREGVTS